MKKILLVVLFLLILTGVFGQTKQENRWMLGRWTLYSFINRTADNRFDLNNREWTGGTLFQLNEFILWDDGTGFLGAGDITFSIVGNRLFFFDATGNDFLISFTFYRINDNRMILEYNNRFFNFEKQRQ